MSSLRMRRSITASVYGKSIKYSPTLQPGAGIGDCRYRSLSPAGKRRLWSASCSVRGSMTVEAAVIIPLLLFLIWNLTSVMEMLRLHSRLELALWKYGKVMAVGSYLLADNEEPDNAEADGGKNDGGKNDGSGGENTDESSEGTNEWLGAFGLDADSIIADPKFKDIANYDFTLADDSPAYDIDFKPIDISDVGPRK